MYNCLVSGVDDGQVIKMPITNGELYVTFKVSVIRLLSRLYLEFFQGLCPQTLITMLPYLLVASAATDKGPDRDFLFLIALFCCSSQVAASKLFERDGADVHSSLSVNFAQVSCVVIGYIFIFI